VAIPEAVTQGEEILAATAEVIREVATLAEATVVAIPEAVTQGEEILAAAKLVPR